MKHLPTLLYLLWFVNPTSQLYAQQYNDSLPQPKSFVTQGKLRSGGQDINYTATAAETYLTNEAGEPSAAIWSVAYLQDDVQDMTQRPVTFVFNGGPGSASVWLHMGMFGPQLVKVATDADQDDGAAPYQLASNEYALLDLTDLVFIDPVGTGYSRVIGKGKVEDYWGLTEDANSVAQFIRQWVTENKRWFSPKYIAGESFGTTRAAGVAHALEGGGQSMALNGLILISQALDYAGSTSTHDNITSYLTYLPSMAATAWYHKKAGQGKTLEAFVEECRVYVYSEYVTALYRGALLSEDEKLQVAEKLNYFTSLDVGYIMASDLRILMHRFQKQLLADQGLAVGRLDGRYMADEVDKVSEGPHLGDPASYQIGAAYTAALNHYYAATLNVKMDRPYLTSNSAIYGKWNWKPVSGGWEPAYVNVARKLSEAMRRNTDLRVMVASGYYDLICPFFDAEYTFTRHGIQQKQVTMTYYEAGHMMYVHEDDFVKLAQDIRSFLTSAE